MKLVADKKKLEAAAAKSKAQRKAQQKLAAVAHAKKRKARKDK
jgi:hypothetical protein